MKGKTNNPNGRPKGAKGKLSQSVRAMLADYVGKEMREFPKLVEDLTSAERCNLLAKILPFVVPKAEQADEAKELEFLIGHISTLNEVQADRLGEIVAEILARNGTEKETISARLRT